MTIQDAVLKELRNAKSLDLNFSKCLHKHLESYIANPDNDENISEYLDTPESGFKAFLRNYSVGRNLSSDGSHKKAVIKLLFDALIADKTMLETATEIQAKGLSVKRKKTGRHDFPYSMVSKMYTFHRPDIHFPYDKNAVKALKAAGYKVQNQHEAYQKDFKDYEKKYPQEILEIKNALPDYSDVKEGFKKVDGFNLDNFLLHRITDKILWVKGLPTPKKKEVVV